MKRILVTRPLAQNASLVQALQQCGDIPLVFPLLAIETFNEIINERKDLCLVMYTFTFPNSFKGGEKLTERHCKQLYKLTGDIFKDLLQELKRETSIHKCFDIPTRFLEVKEPQWERFVKTGCLYIHAHILMFNKWDERRGKYFIHIEDLLDIWGRVLNRYSRELFGKELLIEAPSVQADKVKHIGGVKQYVNKLAGVRNYLNKNGVKGKGITKQEMFRRLRLAGYKGGFDWVTCDHKETLKEIKEYEKVEVLEIDIPIKEIWAKLKNNPQIKSIFQVLPDGSSEPVALCIQCIDRLRQLDYDWHYLVNSLKRMYYWALPPDTA